MGGCASSISPGSRLERITDPDRRGLLGELLRLLMEAFGESLVSVVVFGSVARGKPKPGSDIDLLVTEHA